MIDDSRHVAHHHSMVRRRGRHRTLVKPIVPIDQVLQTPSGGRSMMLAQGCAPAVTVKGPNYKVKAYSQNPPCSGVEDEVVEIYGQL